MKKDSIAKINKEKIIRQAEKTQDSLLNTVPSMDRRAFNKLLEGLVNMGQDAKKVLNDPDLSSSKEFTSKNQFIKYANKARSAAKYATKYLDGYPEGYYLIANVFKVDLYSDRFNKKLIELGFKDSRIIFNPQNKYQYVSIAYYTDKNQADTAYLNNLGDRYFGEMWILRILKPKAKVESSKKLLKENKLLKNDN